jgi:hypothetical protein
MVKGLVKAVGITYYFSYSYSVSKANHYGGVAGLKGACVSYEKLSLAIVAVNMGNVDFNIFLGGQTFTLQFSVESLFDFLDKLRFAAESVVSELDT